MEQLPQNLKEMLTHGKEETYLEYKGDISWDSRRKMLEIVQTIFALSNEKEGGVIIVGVEDNGNLIGLSDDNYNTFSHDRINQYLDGRGNQNIQCKVDKKEVETGGKQKRIVFIQVSESKEFPLVYTGNQELINKSVQNSNNKNIGLRTGALYIRNKLNVGNKEINNLNEWQDLVERTHKKFEKETLRRYSIIKNEKNNPFDAELNI